MYKYLQNIIKTHKAFPNLKFGRKRRIRLKITSVTSSASDTP